MSKPKIAIVHDWLYGGGAEKVVLEIHKLYPEASVYTSFCTDEWRRKLDNKVITGYLQRWPFAKLRRLLPLLRQWWFARLDLSEYDIIISSSGNGEAKFVRKSRPEQLHICYCHTPTHFYWRHYDEYIKRPSFRPRWLARLGLKTLVRPLKKRDFAAARLRLGQQQPLRGKIRTPPQSLGRNRGRAAISIKPYSGRHQAALPRRPMTRILFQTRSDSLSDGLKQTK